MGQILLIESNEDLAKVIKLNLIKSYELEVIEKRNVDDGINLIEILPDISLVIIREAGDNLIQIKELAMYLKEVNSPISLLVIGKNKSNYQNEILLDPQNSWKVLIDMVGKTAGKENRADYKTSNAEYIGIPIAYFFGINESSMGCDIYIRVKKNDNEFQYIKRLNSTDNFERKDIERYQTQGLKEFYISKSHFPQFVNYVTDKLILKLGDDSLSVDQKIEATSDAYSVIANRIKILGVDERTVEVVNESLKQMSNMVGEKNALADYLKALKNNKLSFAYSHSYLSCLLLNMILKSFEWDSNTVREKITYICYFHDISLDNETLVKIDSLAELNQLKLSDEDKKKVIEHALKSAETVDLFPQVPIGVSSLIREHHGVKTGVGFRESLSINLSPIAMMFLVVEDFVKHFLAYEKAPSREELVGIFDRLEAEYNKTTYAQTMMALRVAILKDK